MTTADLQEGQRLQSLIGDYRKTLEIFEKMEEKEYQTEIAEFLTGMKMIPNKKQMAAVMRDAVIESCESYIEQAQERFDNL